MLIRQAAASKSSNPPFPACNISPTPLQTTSLLSVCDSQSYCSARRGIAKVSQITCAVNSNRTSFFRPSVTSCARSLSSSAGHTGSSLAEYFQRPMTTLRAL
ncbi:uncharacterized protein M421DRAFT_166821 [Didymella exigua CBS 183.55]|uniref:Uncharacterized protein n=1 Tax=Didymella exigua CBS 183.55 TaxID=1150837 RepID=A0A6A5RI81_9PLEO|nr:uncharacterized protein M421DRAFT_166821 [Didymella exigua CBS 183.55]KAF1928045.1 hypothetical protein M421DRAFT_166821 [Didymella exigua CBS 183.55]